MYRLAIVFGIVVAALAPADAGSAANSSSEVGAAAALTVTVVDGATGKPLPGFEVRVYRRKHVVASYGPTDDDGVLRISQIRRGLVKVVVFDTRQTEYSYEWFDEGDNYDTATEVELVNGVETAITVNLDAGAGRIVGTVTNQIGGEPLEDVPVFVQGAGFLADLSSATGDFEINGLRHIPYRVKYDGLERCSRMLVKEACNYQTRWHGGSTHSTGAAVVTPGIDETLVLDMALDIIRCRGIPATIVGTRGDDHVSASIDTYGLTTVVIAALGGDDSAGVSGKLPEGSDPPLICGGRGRDRLRGGGNLDRIYGGQGRDTINGGGGDDLVFGGADSDFIEGGPGLDTLFGGPGTDTLRGGRGRDTLRGGPGDGDVVKGEWGADELFGGAGVADECRGGSGLDVADASCEIVVAEQGPM